MERRLRGRTPFILLLLALAARAQADTPPPLVRAGIIPLPGVAGRIDHMALDLAGRRLFVAALGNNTVEVIDLRTSEVIHTITGLKQPQGVYYAPEPGLLYVTNGGDGLCEIYDGTTLRLASQIDMGGDADNIHPDPAEGRILVSAGHGIAFLDTAHDTLAAAVALPGHPEGFALEEGTSRVYVNVPVPSGSVFVLDRRAGTVTARWSLGGPFANALSNFPLAIDEADGRLFTGIRVPSSLAVLDTTSGRVITVMKLDRDPDDVFYDRERRRVYVSCGQGSVDVFQHLDGDHYQPLPRVATAAGARTSLWSAELRQLFVAFPAARGQPAGVMIFSAAQPGGPG